MLSVQTAQDLRATRKEFETKLEELKAQHAQAKSENSKSDMIQLTKQMIRIKQQIENIQNALQDAPVEPWEPEQVWSAIEEKFTYQKNFEEVKIKFLEKLSNFEVAYTFSWYADDMIKTAEWANETKWVHILVENYPFLEERIDRFLERFPIWLKQLEEAILRAARKQTSRSTSQASIFVEDARLEALAELYERFTEFSSLNRYIEHYKSWKELKNAN